MNKVVKRDGRVVEFKKEKIVNAITKAGDVPEATKEKIATEIEGISKNLSVEEISDLVEKKLMATSYKDVAKAYIEYRFIHKLVRESNTTDKAIKELLNGDSDYWNKENSNKNARVVTTQRDYLAGITSTDITRRFLLPEDVVKAHDEGIIHFHDADYFAQNALHNCFDRSTKFITSNGIKSFEDFNDGDSVIVPTHTGEWKTATVHNYGKQDLYEVTLKRGPKTTRKVLVTDNHRWILRDGTITTKLSVGDKLIKTPNIAKIDMEQSFENWEVTSKEYVKNDEVWCLSVDENHSFILEGGIVTGNCDLINLEDMLQNGTVINGVMIERPHRLITATTIATQIITAVASSQYGGCTITLSHLAPFVRDSWNIYYAKYKEWGMNEKQCKEYADKDLRKEISDSVQTFNYQINSMSTTNGQAPFLSVNMYLNETKEYKKELALLIEEFLKQRIVGMKNEQGVYVTPAFPKLLYVLEEDNVNVNSPYFYLTKIAAECTAKRMVPDYISEKVMKRDKIDANGDGQCYPCMGCRSFLTTYVDENGNPKYYGRFNQGVVTLNLPDIALSAVKIAQEECEDNTKPNKEAVLNKFWDIFEERTELCHKALRARHDRLANATSDVAPILWQHGALARLKPGESIRPLLHNGYSTISLGYAGLYECVKALIGESHSHGKGKELGLEIMEALNRKTKQWKEDEKIDYSLYGSPIESGTYKFAKCLKKRFGVIEGITDKDYITNSYHVNVREEIDPFEKLSIESEFQKLSPGGAISYVECADMTHNLDAVIEVIQFIYNNIMYAELNTKSDYCHVCGSTKEIKILDIDGELVWECPVCGNRNQTKMNVARRT